MHGVGRPRLNLSEIKSIQVPLAPRSEQDRIVEAIEEQFTRLDAAVEGLKRVQRRLKRYRAAVLKAACEGRLVPTEAELARAAGRDYESADRLLARILEERRARFEAEQLAKMQAAGRLPLSGAWKTKYGEPKSPAHSETMSVPSGWAVVSLEQLTDPVRVICYGILMPKEHVPGGVMYVKVKDMRGDRIDVAALQRTTPEIAAMYARASLRPGDLLLAIRGTYGRVAEVPDELDGANITQDSARLALMHGANRKYIALCLRGPAVQQFFRRAARGVGVKGVNIGDVRLTPVPLPPLAEQERIAAEIERRLSVVEKAEVTVEASLKRAARMRQAILKRAFEGKLVAQDPNDEPASALLERIRTERERAAGLAPKRRGRRPAATGTDNSEGLNGQMRLLDADQGVAARQRVVRRGR